MDFSQNDVVVQSSGWIPNVEPGKKCVHGVYIAMTKLGPGGEVLHDEPTFADKCGNCQSLKAFMELHDMTLEEIEQRQRIIWTHTDKADVKEFLKAIPIRRKQ